MNNVLSYFILNIDKSKHSNYCQINSNNLLEIISTIEQKKLYICEIYTNRIIIWNMNTNIYKLIQFNKILGVAKNNFFNYKYDNAGVIYYNKDLKMLIHNNHYIRYKYYLNKYKIKYNFSVYYNSIALFRNNIYYYNMYKIVNKIINTYINGFHSKILINNKYEMQYYSRYWYIY
jgi:hypothetical protein